MRDRDLIIENYIETHKITEVMTTTFEELNSKLKSLDEVTILEVLDISSEDIIDRFQDIVEERYDYLINEFPDETQED